MSDDLFKGIARFIDPSIRDRFGPTFRAAAQLLKPNPIINNPSTANLLRSPSLANLGRVLSDVAITSTEVLPGGKLVTTPVKKVSKITEDLLKKATTTGSEEFLKATKSNTPLNNALRKIGEEKISQTTTTDLLKLLENNYDIKVGPQAITKKNIKTKPAKGAGSGNKFDTIKQALESVENPQQYSVKDLMNLPQVKKAIEETGIDMELFRKYKSKLGITQPTRFFEKLNVDEKEVIEYLKNNPRTTTDQLKGVFPKLKNISNTILGKWRKENNLVKPKKESRAKSILEIANPELSKQLDFISQSGGVLPSNVPIKHKDAFSEIITINRDGKPLDVKRTKIYQAHGIGEGSVTTASDQIIKSKVAMIPNKFLDDVKLPKFFLTRSGNNLHRNIEDKLVLALVNKYDKLGYNFVDGAWKQTKKVNPKSVNKELKDLETEIDGYRDQLKEIDAYTLFYNPIKDRMVSYGQDIDEIPGLSNLLNQVKQGKKKLRYGGIVSMEEMINRPIYERY